MDTSVPAAPSASAGGALGGDHSAHKGFLEPGGASARAADAPKASDQDVSTPARSGSDEPAPRSSANGPAPESAADGQHVTTFPQQRGGAGGGSGEENSAGDDSSDEDVPLASRMLARIQERAGGSGTPPLEVQLQGSPDAGAGAGGAGSGEEGENGAPDDDTPRGPEGASEGRGGFGGDDADSGRGGEAQGVSGQVRSHHCRRIHTAEACLACFSPSEHNSSGLIGSSSIEPRRDCTCSLRSERLPLIHYPGTQIYLVAPRSCLTASTSPVPLACSLLRPRLPSAAAPSSKSSP